MTDADENVVLYPALVNVTLIGALTWGVADASCWAHRASYSCSVGDHFGGDGVCARNGGTVRLQHHRYHRGRHDADGGGGGGGGGGGFVNPFPYLFARAISHGLAVDQGLARPHFQHASIRNDGGLPGSVCYSHW